MVYRGHIERGNVVFDDPAALDEGTKVEVHVVNAPSSSPEKVPRRHWLEFSGAIDDLPPDASMRIDEILYGRPDE
jgi:hypothetical protein